MILFCVFALSADIAAAADEMHTYSVEDFSTCCPGCGVLPWANDTSNQVYDDFGAWTPSLWDVARYNQNSAADGLDWTDDDEEPTWGADDASTWGADAADVAFIFTHGGSGCWTGSGSAKMWVVMGDESGVDTADECRPDSSGQWRFGDDADDLEFVVNGACHGADTCAWTGGAFDVSPATKMHGTDLRVYLGFHGIAYDAPWTSSEVDAFVTTSRSNGIGSHWLSEMVEINILADDDQCPVAVVWGTDDTDTLDFYSSGGFSDRTNPTPHEKRRKTYMSPCDPDEGPTR